MENLVLELLSHGLDDTYMQVSGHIDYSFDERQTIYF